MSQNIHDALIDNYSKNAMALLAMSDKKSEAISEMLGQLENLVNPDASPMKTFWIFVDSRFKLSNPRESRMKPITNPMGRHGEWKECMFI